MPYDVVQKIQITTQSLTDACESNRAILSLLRLDDDGANSNFIGLTDLGAEGACTESEAVIEAGDYFVDVSTHVAAGWDYLVHFEFSPVDRCGDGVKNPEEGCDDGNRDAGDGCSPECVIENACADGGIELGAETWQRDDIAFCSRGDESTAKLSVADAAALCGPGWHLCPPS